MTCLSDTELGEKNLVIASFLKFLRGKKSNEDRSWLWQY